MVTSEFHCNEVVQYKNVQDLGMCFVIIIIKKFLVSLRQSKLKVTRDNKFAFV